MQYEGKTHFILPTNCFIVDGAERSIIYDLQRGDYGILTGELAAAIRNCTSGSFKDLFSELPPEDLDFYEPFIEELITNDYLIPVDAIEVPYFEHMSTTWNYPYEVSNAIIEYSSRSSYDLIEALKKIDQLGCQAVEIRFTDAWDLPFYEQLSKGIDGMIFRHIDMLICFKQGQEDQFMFELKQLHPAFFCITQYQSPEDKMLKNIAAEYAGLKRVQKNYTDLVNDHGVYPKNFYINKDFFLESLQHHTYFNGKVVIMADGQVRNATNHPHTFGHINEVDLALLMKNPDFTLLWNIPKDNIRICKDCEFRYMCMDSRIPFKNDKNEWEYEDTCNYDPYNCQWAFEEKCTPIHDL